LANTDRLPGSPGDIGNADHERLRGIESKLMHVIPAGRAVAIAVEQIGEGLADDRVRSAPQRGRIGAFRKSATGRQEGELLGVAAEDKRAPNILVGRVVVQRYVGLSQSSILSVVKVQSAGVDCVAELDAEPARRGRKRLHGDRQKLPLFEGFAKQPPLAEMADRRSARGRLATETLADGLEEIATSTHCQNPRLLLPVPF